LFGTVSSLQSSQAAQGAAVTALQSDSVTLFDLTRDNRNDIHEANEGVAMALAMDSPVGLWLQKQGSGCAGRIPDRLVSGGMNAPDLTQPR